MNKKLVLFIAANLLLVLLVVNESIYQKERIVKEGRTVFLKLAPRDPRSLMQGDYMVLRQDLLQGHPDPMATEPTRGKIVLSLDPQNNGTFARADHGTELKDNEIRLKYRRSNRGYLFGLESFFFQEGDAKTYEPARFCEIKVDEKGNAVLVDLLGEGLTKLVPEVQ